MFLKNAYFYILAEMSCAKPENRNSYRKQQMICNFDWDVKEQFASDGASKRDLHPCIQLKSVPHGEPITARSNSTRNISMWGKDKRMVNDKLLGSLTTNSKSAFISKILKGRWREEHNLRERDRRREESIFYELIRTCLSEEEVRRFLPGVKKTPKNLSYQQILQISAKVVNKEIQEMVSFNHLLMRVQILEDACLELGIPLPENRPQIIPPMEKHERYAKIVQEALQMEKYRMHRNTNGGGDGERLPTSREVAMKIDKRLRESDSSFIRESKRRLNDYDDHSSKRHHAFLSNLLTLHSSPCEGVTNEENDSPLTNKKPPHGTKDTPSDIHQHLPPSPGDTIRSLPLVNLHSPHASTTQLFDTQRQEDSKSDGVEDDVALNNVFNSPLLSPSTGVNLGIETEPLFCLLTSGEFDVQRVDT
ncbi:hypothetical protein TcWFU_001935 [Taenia crassiceps]|uniref:Uncharacterized protein n=1 Tax=Taenia crassiceps TaxID=6207 RepID=A0ABR4Q660_9CEST